MIFLDSVCPVMRPVIRLLCLTALSWSLCACSELQERFSGYPKEDTVLNLETASSNEIADALSQLSRIAVVGDDWEFLDPHDMCTVHVIDNAANQSLPLQLQGAQFALHRDAISHKYYAVIQHGQQTVLNHQQQPLRLFEANSYHDVFFAEGYLQELAKKCQHSRTLKAAHRSLAAS